MFLPESAYWRRSLAFLERIVDPAQFSMVVASTSTGHGLSRLCGYGLALAILLPANLVHGYSAPAVMPSYSATKLHTASRSRSNAGSQIHRHRRPPPLIPIGNSAYAHRFSLQQLELPYYPPVRLLPTSSSRSPWALKASFSSSSSSESNYDGDVIGMQLLISDTGGGHRASANAIRDALDVLHPGKFACDIVDIYTEYGPFWPYNDYPGGYKIMAKYTWLWQLYYSFGCTAFGIWLNVFLVELFCFANFTKCLARPNPGTGQRADMVVSVHPLTQEVPQKILAYLDSHQQTRDYRARQTPFCTVVTDLGSAHPCWFESHVDKCYVPSDALRQAAKDRGLRDAQIIQYGLPIRQGFWNRASGAKVKTREEWRKELGIDEHLVTVLVVGGGDGMGGLVQIAKSLGRNLGRSDKQLQLVVVCGNNKEAKQELERSSWPGGVKVKINGFVQNMDEWMKGSDCIVTKAGPGTIAEASICGLPCMLFAYLPGQEEGNIPFVENAGFGTFSNNPTDIAKTVKAWLESPAKLEALKDAAFKAARPQATLDIAKDLADTAFAHRQKQSSVTPQKVAVRRR